MMIRAYDDQKAIQNQDKLTQFDVETSDRFVTQLGGVNKTVKKFE